MVHSSQIKFQRFPMRLLPMSRCSPAICRVTNDSNSKTLAPNVNFQTLSQVESTALSSSTQKDDAKSTTGPSQRLRFLQDI